MPTTVEKFDPKSLVKSAEHVATKSRPKKKAVKKTAKEAAAESEQQNGSLDSALIAVAKKIVGAQELLAKIDSRTGGKINAGNMRLSIVEDTLLKNVFPWLENRHHIAAEVQRVRRARELRETGVSREAITEADLRFNAARKAASDALVDVEAINEEAVGELLVDHLRRQQKKLDQLNAEAKEAEANLTRSKQAYEVLLLLAPKSLLNRDEENRAESKLPVLKSKHEEMRRRIQAIKSKAKILEKVDVEKHGSDANMHSLAWSILPEAVSRNLQGSGYTIDQYACHAKAKDLNAQIPAIEQELREATDAIDRERDRVQSPLHEWALSGQLTIRMLLD